MAALVLAEDSAGIHKLGAATLTGAAGGATISRLLTSACLVNQRRPQTTDFAALQAELRQAAGSSCKPARFMTTHRAYSQRRTLIRQPSGGGSAVRASLFQAAACRVASDAVLSDEPAGQPVVCNLRSQQQQQASVPCRVSQPSAAPSGFLNITLALQSSML